MVQDDGPVGLDGVGVVFDDDRVVSDAGIVLVATLAQRLGLERLIVQLARLRADRRLEALAASGEGRGVEYQWITAERSCFAPRARGMFVCCGAEAEASVVGER